MGGGGWLFQPASGVGVGAPPNYSFLGVLNDTTSNPVVNIDTPGVGVSGPQQNALRVGTNGYSQFQVCNFGSGLAAFGANIFGSTVACPSIYTTAVFKNVFMTGNGLHQLIRGWNSSTSQTAAFLDMNTATAAGTGFNFFEGWTGVTGTDTFHTGGTKTFAIQGDGSYLMNGCAAGTYVKADGTGCGTPAGGGGSMVYPGVGIPQSTGAGWGTSYAVGAAAGNLLALDGSANLTLPGNLTINGQFSVAGPWSISSAPSTTAMAAAAAGHSSLGISNDGNFYISANAGTPSQVCTVASGCGGTAAVGSVFGRTGAVVAMTGHYTAAQVTGAVPNTITVNGHALSANVTVSASDLTTGTLPHAQLPALVSGDIPANAANISGTAANLTATTQSAGDNSTKLATTAYVKNEMYLVWSCTPNSFTTVGNYCAWTTPAPITITGFDYSNIGAVTCTTYPVVSVYDANAGAVVGSFTITLTNSSSTWSATGNTNVAAGHVLRIRTSTAAVGCTSGGLGASVTYQTQN